MSWSFGLDKGLICSMSVIPTRKRSKPMLTLMLDAEAWSETM
jgi:hypothetical protein